MIIKPLRSLFVLLLLIIQYKYAIPQTPPDKAFYIKADNVQNSIDLKLSDLADSFRFVALETSKNAIINSNNYFVGKDFIIAFSQDGIYKFLSNGKFLKKIAAYGRGPDEIMGFGFSYFCDEKNNLLYLDDYNLKNKFLVYDLRLEKFITPIKKSIPGNWSSFAIYQDSLIIGTPPYPFSSDSKPYSLFIQNLKGNILSNILNSKKVLWGPKQVRTFQRSFLTIWNNNYRISFEFDDTLFTLKNNRLVPYLFLGFNSPRNNLPSSIIQKGDRRLNFKILEAQDYIIFGVSIVEDVTRVSESAIKSTYEKKYFIFNKISGKSEIIRTYKDDFSRVIQTSGDSEIKFPAVLSNGKLVVIYQPTMIKEILIKGLDNSIFTPSLKEELINLNKNLNETDNPVLLIGRVKQKI